MRRRQQPAQARDGGSEYFYLVAAAEHCVRIALDREKLPPVNPEPIMDWLDSMSENGDP
jgi:hypothetical protein